MPLIRVDNATSNMLAGSILFLRPSTTYEVELSLADPDGGDELSTTTVSTRPVPRRPTGGKLFHVIPGSGGGSGTEADPFRGIPAAEAVAQPADVFVLHAGLYPFHEFVVGGSPANYVVWQAAGDGVAEIDRIQVSSSHLWLEGITVRDQAEAIYTRAAAEDVVITRCRLENNSYGINIKGPARAWYIADNRIIGTTPPLSGSFSGEGVQLGPGGEGNTNDHVVAYNSITFVADGISYPGSNVDMYGNDIFDTSDDGIEFDYGYSNNRAWGNRIHNSGNNGLSWQPQYNGPWYMVRNQVVSRGAVTKFRGADRFVLLHNLFIGSGEIVGTNKNELLRGIVHNNIWIALTDNRILRFEEGDADWRTALDFNAYDWTSVNYPFRWATKDSFTIQEFAMDSGLETHGIGINRIVCFPDLPAAPIPHQTFSMAPSCPAVDAGIVIPGFNDGYLGVAPDMGPYESGTAAPCYGPRPVAPVTPTNLRIVR
jgi:hypothetical protein